jgi:hypothetical protein
MSLTIEQAFFKHIVDSEGFGAMEPEQLVTTLMEGDGIYWQFTFGPEIKLIKLYGPDEALENIWKDMGYYGSVRQSEHQSSD